MREIEKAFPDKISNSRGLGLLCAFDLPSKEMRNEFRRRLFDNRLIILGCGEKAIRFRTALNITDEELEQGLRIIRKVLAEM